MNGELGIITNIIPGKNGVNRVVVTLFADEIDIVVKVDDLLLNFLYDHMVVAVNEAHTEILTNQKS
ncbi:hypothetical protein [Furfurilactobacillus rossiae]|uniref:Uncharacterized protein n=1 Tax=Furfurilactobacillus rossiae DSM 15814 TaxID=1114972 RepID=A0A0R1RGW7_9LACO|nr:hypothetical protein [Furfurilactobacillus rossiae]KRL54010.1 hypothetical protein FD35_GL000713 [Furfurilactobacillus rossiae DSM 15814]QFR68160.1 hypothetical protein LR814_13390 [Furfurilactobacillus rossiae]QLE62674.1 hypothetical protein LROSRS0_p10038 [Furfurilactobacillus rossiae]HAT53995.1 hypothetical protein [Lactobacillus sp.]